MSVNQRIEQIILNKFAGVNRQMAESIDVLDVTIGRIRNGKQSPHVEVLEKIIQKLKVDAHWLMTGEGSMNGEDVNDPMRAGRKKADYVQYFDVDALASPLEVFNDQTTVPDDLLYVPGYGDCNFACNCVGSSMEPDIPAGSIVLCKKVSKDIYRFGQAYIIITSEHRMIKYIRRHPDESKIIARSANRKLFDDIDIPKDDILHLYIIKGIANQRII